MCAILSGFEAIFGSSSSSLSRSGGLLHIGCSVVSWLVARLDCWLDGWLAWLAHFFTSSFAQIAWPPNLRTYLLALLWFVFLCWLWQLDFALTVCLVCSICSIRCSCEPRTRVILKLVWSDPNSLNFQITGNSFVKWSWARFFWRPLQKGVVEIFLATPQLHQTFQPTRF